MVQAEGAGPLPGESVLVVLDAAAGRHEQVDVVRGDPVHVVPRRHVPAVDVHVRDVLRVAEEVRRGRVRERVLEVEPHDVAAPGADGRRDEAAAVREQAHRRAVHVDRGNARVDAHVDDAFGPGAVRGDGRVREARPDRRVDDGAATHPAAAHAAAHLPEGAPSHRRGGNPERRAREEDSATDLPLHDAPLPATAGPRSGTGTRPVEATAWRRRRRGCGFGDRPAGRCGALTCARMRTRERHPA